MAIAVQNTGFIQSGRAQIYLAAYPGTYAGANLAAKITTLANLFYANASQRYTPLMNQYIRSTEAGFAYDLKQNLIEADFHAESKSAQAIQDFDGSIEIDFYDCDVDHLKDMISAGSLDLTSIPAATGLIAGRDQLVVGNQVSLTHYALMLRAPSGNKITRTSGSGLEFDHWFFPNVVPMFNPKFEWKKNKMIDAKVKFDVLYQGDMLDAAGYPIMALADTAKAIGLV
jgi:hypothetical protein